MSGECACVREDLEAYLSGDLTAVAAARVARHLELCADCTSERDELDTLMADLRHAAHAVRPLHGVSALELQLPAAKRRRRWLPYAAALLLAWSAAMTVFVFVPAATEHAGFLPAGHALQDAQRRAAAAVERAVAAARDQLLAAQLGIPPSAAATLREYLDAVAAERAPQETVSWTVTRVGDEERPFRPGGGGRRVGVKATASIPGQTDTGQIEWQVVLTRSARGQWQASPSGD